MASWHHVSKQLIIIVIQSCPFNVNERVTLNIIKLAILNNEINLPDEINGLVLNNELIIKYWYKTQLFKTGL